MVVVLRSTGCVDFVLEFLSFRRVWALEKIVTWSLESHELPDSQSL
jgi:hypothetical protein